MKIEVLEPLTIRFNGQRTPYRPGDVLTLPDEAGRKLLERAKGKVRIAAIDVGSTIRWEGADMSARTGVVDFVHTDADGVLWAFVTTFNGWSAVNVKYASVTSQPEARA